MRDYGKVHTRFWLTPETLMWSDDAKLLYLYLLSSPHCNLLGCFRIPLGYLSEDLQWQVERVQAALAELIEAKRIIRCEQTGWTLLHDFLMQNPIENPNQGKAAQRLLEDVPSDFVGMAALQQTLRQFSHRLPETEAIPPSTLIKSHPKRSTSTRTVSSTNKSTAKNASAIPQESSRDNTEDVQPDDKPISSCFEDFWTLQTRKEKRGAAQIQWVKLGLQKDPIKAQQVIDAWRVQRQTRLQYQTLKLTPLPCNWLENEQWNDEYEQVDPQHVDNHGVEQLNATDGNQFVAQRWAESE